MQNPESQSKVLGNLSKASKLASEARRETSRKMSLMRLKCQQLPKSKKIFSTLKFFSFKLFGDRFYS